VLSKTGISLFNDQLEIFCQVQPATITKKWDVMDAPKFLSTFEKQYENSNVTIPSGIAAQIANKAAGAAITKPSRE
jgi:hypothetical protein